MHLPFVIGLIFVLGIIPPTRKAIKKKKKKIEQRKRERYSERMR